ncbi:hypothetical protein C2W62_37280 [Candidatus Entotheonella serta]|nr:hypothetical protein C2W62_37280 [Candidatus Entotheonella serta]
MNPMGDEHNVQLLQTLIDLEAEEAADQAVEEANRRLTLEGATLRVGLVIIDDLRGQWTNRYFTETSHRFNARGETRRHWATVCCWTSESWTQERIHQETLASIFRVLYTQRHGFPKRLGAMLQQEGLAMYFAHMMPPPLSADDLDYSRDLIEPLLDTKDFPTLFGVLYGDEAARSVGYEPLGLSERAGFAVAFDMIQQSSALPDAIL